MADDWQDLVIETGVDTLLNYLAENGEAPTSKISKDLGVSEKRIKQWAKALESNDFVEKRYSARKGLILKYTKSNKEEVDERLEEVKREVDRETEKVMSEMKSRSSEIAKEREKLEEMTKELEENQEEEEELKERLEELQSLENELSEKLEKQEKKRVHLHQENLELLSRIDNSINQIDRAKEQADKFESKSDKIKKKVKALKKLEKHSESVEEIDRELEELKKKEGEESNIFKSFKNSLKSLVPSKKQSEKPDTDEILSGSLEDAKKKIDQRNITDYEKLLEHEKNHKDRKTMKEFLKRNTR